MAYLAFAATAMLGYPTYVLLNLDNVRPFQQARFSEELKQALEERRQLRKFFFVPLVIQIKILICFVRKNKKYQTVHVQSYHS